MRDPLTQRWARAPGKELLTSDAIDATELDQFPNPADPREIRKRQKAMQLRHPHTCAKVSSLLFLIRVVLSFLHTQGSESTENRCRGPTILLIALLLLALLLHLFTFLFVAGSRVLAVSIPIFLLLLLPFSILLSQFLLAGKLSGGGRLGDEARNVYSLLILSGSIPSKRRSEPPRNSGRVELS